MDVCLGLGVGETMLTLMMRNRKKCPAGTFQDPSAEQPRGTNLSRAFVSRNAPLECEMDEPLRSDRLNHDARSVSSVSDTSSDDSRRSRSCSSTASSTSSYSKMSLWGARKREGRKPVLLQKTPFGKSTDYLTVHVGTRWELSVKYVISRRLLTHPLFRVLLKCSEDEFGEDYTVKKGVSIACDPALFLEVVKAVDNDLCSAQNDIGAWAGMTTNTSDYSESGTLESV